MNRRGERAVRFFITANSIVDGYGYGYGRGEVMLDEVTANLFLEKDKGYIIYDDEQEALTDLKGLGEPLDVNQDGDVESKELVNGTSLPDNFPVRNTLIENGYDTVEKVVVAGETLTKLNGITQAKLKKIAFALNELH